MVNMVTWSQLPCISGGLFYLTQ